MSRDKSKRNNPLPLLDEVEHNVDKALADDVPFYRLDKLGTYDWVLIEKRGDKETVLKKDTQEICWAYMKRAIIQGVR